MRKKYLFILLMFLLACNFKNQKFEIPKTSNCKEYQLKEEILKLEYVQYIPELSGDKEFWELVKLGDEILPCLLDLVSDTAVTNVNRPNNGGNYRVGDISFVVINQIVLCIPYGEISSSNFNKDSNNIIDYLNEDIENRLVVEEELKNWFVNNSEKLVWVSDTVQYRQTANWEYADYKHPAKGYYTLKENIKTCSFAN